MPGCTGHGRAAASGGGGSRAAAAAGRQPAARRTAAAWLQGGEIAWTGLPGATLDCWGVRRAGEAEVLRGRWDRRLAALGALQVRVSGSRSLGRARRSGFRQAEAEKHACGVRRGAAGWKAASGNGHLGRAPSEALRAPY